MVKKIGQSFRRFLIRWIAQAVIVALFLVYMRRKINHNVQYFQFSNQITFIISMCLFLFMAGIYNESETIALSSM